MKNMQVYSVDIICEIFVDNISRILPEKTLNNSRWVLIHVASRPKTSTQCWLIVVQPSMILAYHFTEMEQHLVTINPRAYIVS